MKRVKKGEDPAQELAKPKEKEEAKPKEKEEAKPKEEEAKEATSKEEKKHHPRWGERERAYLTCDSL